METLSRALDSYASLLLAENTLERCRRKHRANVLRLRGDEQDQFILRARNVEIALHGKTKKSLPRIESDVLDDIRDDIDSIRDNFIILDLTVLEGVNATATNN